MEDCEFLAVSSLEKIRGSQRPKLIENESVMMTNEVFSFQIAMTCAKWGLPNCTIEVCGDLKDSVQVRAVELSPCAVPIIDPMDFQDYYETIEPALIPDLLRPLCAAGFTIQVRQWRALWVTVKNEKGFNAGEYSLKFKFQDREGNFLGELSYKLCVINAKLAEQELIFTNWLHYDSLCHYYKVKPLSAEFYRLVRSFAKNAVEHGVNTVYVPLFTPPLDTAVGAERLTVQLIGIEKIDNEYIFDFSQFKKFVEIMSKVGIKYFEMSHLYTQWGASSAPKIIAKVNGKEMKIFGWETDAHGEEYTSFLKKFLKCLIKEIKFLGIENKTFFHISDEPSLNDVQNYSKACFVVKECIEDIPYIDALSSVEMYNTGVIKTPIPSTSHANEFLKLKVPGLWVYYCCAQYKDGLSNCFLSMPSQRTRVIGLQLYLNNIAGFLHWGFNFYGSFLSKEQINPFCNTDAHGVYPAGDTFIVYPGFSDALDSIRHEVLFDAIQDIRALKTLELKIGREQTEKLLVDEGMSYDFTTYPQSAAWHLSLRKKIYELILE